MNLQGSSNPSSAKLPPKINKYQIIEELGRGGMGCVYKAFDPDMRKFVALKIFFESKDQEKQMQRFIRETQAMAKMYHPNIVKVYITGSCTKRSEVFQYPAAAKQQERVQIPIPDCEAGKGTGSYVSMPGNPTSHSFFTMDYIEGSSLKEFLKSTELNIRLFSQLMVKIAKAMAYAHEQGVIHRDLKPANIMIDKNGEPYIMDFGLAKLTRVGYPLGASLTKVGAVLGTPRYMSPQQANGEKVNHLTDVYALGAIFYEMLAAKPLIEGESITNIVFNVIHQEPALLRQVNNKITLDLETICHKAVAKEIHKRYQSAQEFSEDIERFLHGELIKARTANIWERTWDKLKKNRQIVVGLLIVIIGTSLFNKHYNALEVHSYLAKARELQKKVNGKTSVEKQIQVNIKISNLLEKALEISPHNFKVREQLIKVKETMGILAKEQKNYLLSFVLFKQCENLGYRQANKLLDGLEQRKNLLKRNHKKFINKVMKEISQETVQQSELIDKCAFTIAKMQRPHVVDILVPYLKKDSKNQRLLAIKALGKLGNRYTKFRGKDSVEWLLSLLRKFKDKRMIENAQQEVEEIIWALGWLKDKRANNLVYQRRCIAGQGSLLWMKTKIPYKWIPIEKESAKNAEQFFIRGQMKLEKGNYAGAITDFTQAITLNPKFSLAYNSRGLAYNTLKKHSRAMADFTRAISLNPKSLLAYNNRGSAYNARKEYLKAVADLTRAISLNPKSLGVYYNRGSAYNNLKEHTKAIADYTQAISLNPKFSLAYNGRGLAHSNLKKYPKAIADYTQAIAFNPKFSHAYNNRGLAYNNLKEYIRAIADYSQAIAINPKFLQAYDNRGNSYSNLKEYSRAIADYTQAIALGPKYSRSYNNRGLAYNNLKEYTRAVADLTQAIVLNPKFSRAYNNRGLAYDNLKKYSKAITDYTQAIAFNPKYSEAYNSRGLTYYYLKKYSKAIADFTQAIAINPKLPETYNSRGLAYHYLKEHTRAVADFTQAIALNSKYSKAYNSRGLIYYYLKKYAKAIADLTQAIALNPKYLGAYHNRGLIYYRLKKYAKAMADFTQVIALNPKHSEAYNNRGSVYNNLKEYAKAIADFTQAIALNPKYLHAYNGRGLLYYRLKKYSRAIADFTQVIALNPNFLEAYNSRGNSYNNLKEYTKAIADFTQAIVLDPKYSLAYMNRGSIYLQLRQYQKAYNNFKVFLKLSPRDPMAPQIYMWINQLRKNNLIK